MICAHAVPRLGPDGETVETVNPGEAMLELEVTRLREDGLMFWTRQHPRRHLDSLNMPHAGWPYDQQLVRNEKGDKTWVVNMRGDVCQLWLDGRKIAGRDFDDPDGDGRRIVRLLDFGPGDEAVVPVHAHVRRIEPGRFEVRANAACELGLPAAGAPGGYQCSPDGVAWTRLDCRRDGARWVFALPESLLARSALFVRAATDWSLPLMREDGAGVCTAPGPAEVERPTGPLAALLTTRRATHPDREENGNYEICELRERGTDHAPGSHVRENAAASQ